MKQNELAKEALDLVTPGSLTYGNTKELLFICKRFAVAGRLTDKQEARLTTLIAKGNDNAHR